MDLCVFTEVYDPGGIGAVPLWTLFHWDIEILENVHCTNTDVVVIQYNTHGYNIPTHPDAPKYRRVYCSYIDYLCVSRLFLFSCINLVLMIVLSVFMLQVSSRVFNKGLSGKPWGHPEN